VGLHGNALTSLGAPAAEAARALDEIRTDWIACLTKAPAAAFEFAENVGRFSLAARGAAYTRSPIGNPIAIGT
jgi:hypothetical protein